MDFIRRGAAYLGGLSQPGPIAIPTVQTLNYRLPESSPSDRYGSVPIPEAFFTQVQNYHIIYRGHFLDSDRDHPSTYGKDILSQFGGSIRDEDLAKIAAILAMRPEVAQVFAVLEQTGYMPVSFTGLRTVVAVDPNNDLIFSGRHPLVAQGDLSKVTAELCYTMKVRLEDCLLSDEQLTIGFEMVHKRQSCERELKTQAAWQPIRGLGTFEQLVKERFPLRRGNLISINGYVVKDQFMADFKRSSYVFHPHGLDVDPEARATASPVFEGDIGAFLQIFVGAVLAPDVPYLMDRGLGKALKDYLRPFAVDEALVQELLPTAEGSLPPDVSFLFLSLATQEALGIFFDGTRVEFKQIIRRCPDRLVFHIGDDPLLGPAIQITTTTGLLPMEDPEQSDLGSIKVTVTLPLKSYKLVKDNEGFALEGDFHVRYIVTANKDREEVDSRSLEERLRDGTPVVRSPLERVASGLGGMSPFSLLFGGE